MNHDGELDINEFHKVVFQMELTDDENLINDAFASCDIDNSGKLCMQDFEKAYDLLYRSVISNIGKSTAHDNTIKYVFRCVRYGIAKDNVSVVWEDNVFYTIDELEALLKRVAEDDSNLRIKWWIDVAVIKMNLAEKELVAKLLGISKNDIILTGVLPENRHSRMRLGQDAVSFFVQTMWIKNIPLIHSHAGFSWLLG